MGDGTSIGRLKKNDITIAHSRISGEHCLLSKDSVLDKSGFGTYVGVRTGKEWRDGTQSGWVEVEKGVGVRFYNYGLQIVA